MRKSGNSVRITAQLSRASDGQQLWSDAYTREASDVFAVQSELAQAIAERLRGFLQAPPSEADKAQIRTQIQMAARSRTQNAAAHEAYLQGLFHLNRDSVAEANRLLERAVALDPAFALAWADLSRAGWLRGAYASTPKDYEAGFRTARRAAERAITLDPGLAAGWLARSLVQMAVDFDWAGAAESLARASSLAPNDADVLHNSARLAYALGQPERALELVRRSLELDPLHSRKRILLALSLESLGRYEEAEGHFNRVTELSPGSPYAHAGTALMLMRRQRLHEAAAEIVKAPVDWQRLTVQSQVHWALGNKAQADASLKQLHAMGGVAAYQLAQVYAHRGDRDRAFEWLHRAARQRDSGLILCKSDRTFLPLHADPRWTAFLKELGLANPA